MTLSLRGPVPTGWPAWFIDLSEHNSLKRNHWQYLEDHGCAAVMLRAANGTELDTVFHDHAGWAIRHHIAVGAYLFLRPAAVAPIRAQIDALLGQVRALPVPVWNIAIDVEDGKGRPRWTMADTPGRVTRQAVWMTYLATKRRPWVYTYRSFWTQWLAGERLLDAYPLWAARFDRTYTLERLTAEFGRRPIAWQYGGGWVDGLETSPKIDKNVMLPA